MQIGSKLYYLCKKNVRPVRPFNLFKPGCAPPRSAKFNRVTWDQDQAGYKDGDDDKLWNAEPSDEEGKQE